MTDDAKKKVLEVLCSYTDSNRYNAMIMATIPHFEDINQSTLIKDYFDVLYDTPKELLFVNTFPNKLKSIITLRKAQEKIIAESTKHKEETQIEKEINEDD
jgi:hypothetical protein